VRALPPAPARAADLDDDFADGVDPSRWVDAYLSHWTTPERARSRHRVVAGGLELRIEDDQPDWRPEDAPLRVSHLQSGSFAGPRGSTRGTHRHRDDLRVRSETPTRLLFAPTRGRVEVTVSVSRDPACMTAVWLVGTEHLDPDDAGEVCVVEIDGSAVGPTTTARTGIKAHHDAGLRTDMSEVVLPFDASAPHTWTAIWGDGMTTIGCEGAIVRSFPQAPTYPLFLMIDLFEIGPPAGVYPKTATIHRVRGWAM